MQMRARPKRQEMKGKSKAQETKRLLDDSSDSENDIPLTELYRSHTPLCPLPSVSKFSVKDLARFSMVSKTSQRIANEMPTFVYIKTTGETNVKRYRSDPPVQPTIIKLSGKYKDLHACFFAKVSYAQHKNKQHKEAIAARNAIIHQLKKSSYSFSTGPDTTACDYYTQYCAPGYIAGGTLGAGTGAFISTLTIKSYTTNTILLGSVPGGFAGAITGLFMGLTAYCCVTYCCTADNEQIILALEEENKRALQHPITRAAFEPSNKIVVTDMEYDSCYSAENVTPGLYESETGYLAIPADDNNMMTTLDEEDVSQLRNAFRP